MMVVEKEECRPKWEWKREVAEGETEEDAMGIEVVEA